MPFLFAAPLIYSLVFAQNSAAPPRTTAPASQEEVQNLASAQQWRELEKAPDFFREMTLLQSLGQDSHQRTAVLSRLHRMWATYDALRRPEIAYLMCQLGDRSGVEPVAKALFAGDYDTARELEPDGDAAGMNATDDAFRMVILYGTPQQRQRLFTFFKLREDPLRKRDKLCEILLGLSSTRNGPGLPPAYPKEQFPFGLVMVCLDYTEVVGTIVSAPGGSAESQMQRDHDSVTGSLTVHGVVGVYQQRGCDYAAQTIQNLTGRDFGHRISDPISQRDIAVEAIKKWWSESHTATR